MKNRISRACAGHWILRAIWLLLMIGIGVLGRTGTAHAQSGTWAKIADEWQSFTVAGTKIVRFGIDSNWVQKSVTGTGDCDFYFFGSDPAEGFAKQCEEWNSGTSTTTLVATPNPAGITQSVTLTATVIGASPTGSVTFKDGSAALATVALSNGSASYSKVFVVTGAHSLTAEYGGDANNAASLSSELSQTITAPAGTWNTIANEGELFTVTGTKTVRYGAGSHWVQTSVTGTGDCINEFFGIDPIEGVNKQCDELAAAGVTSTTVLSSSVNPVAAGQNLTLTATVTPSNATGTVVFKDGTATLGTAALSGGVAILNTSFTVAGVHSLSAVYAGDAGTAGSTSAVLNETVNGSAPGAVRYVKLEALTDVNGDPWTSVAEFNVLDANAAVIPRTGWSVSADSVETQAEDGAAANAIDGNATSIWTTVWSPPGRENDPPHPHTLVVDLGSARVLGGFKYLPPPVNNFYGAIGSWRLHTSADGSNWNVVAQGDFANDADEKTVLFNSTPPAQLPAPPSSPVPVANYEYDAQGNLTKVVQAPGVSGFGFATVNTYDTLERLKDTTDAKAGKTELSYNGREDLTQVKDPRSLVTQYPRNGLGDATQLVSPDTGTAGHTYDAAGNLETRTDSRGVLATYSYDALNRLTQLVYSQSGQPSLTQSWGYDQSGTGFAHGIGRLTSTSHPAGSTQYSYDAQGRVVSDTQRINAATGANPAQISLATSYAYDAAGNVASIVYPSGRKLEIGYTDGVPTVLGLAPNATATPAPLVSGIEHEPFGAVKGWLWHTTSGTQAHERVFDTAGRPVRYRLGGFVRDLTYDAAGRIAGYAHLDAATGTATTAAQALDQSFGYDELGRVTGIATATASWSIGYDANGNRTGVTLNGTPSVYTTAAASNRLEGTTNPARSFGYDSAGNTTADGFYTATYDLSGRMSTLSKAGITTTYSYDGLGRRVRKVASSGAGSTVVFAYDTQGHLLGEYDASGTALREYVWLGDTPVAVFTPDAANPANPPLVYYVHADHLDAPRVVLDTGGNLRWRWMAEPFGTTAPETNPQGLGAFTLNLRFPGQYADLESGLSYNYFRDYDASIGRYVQSDPIGLEGGINTYAYVEGNPTSFVDPTGRCPWCAAGLALGVWANIGSQLYSDGGNWGQLDYKAVVLSGLAGAASGGLGTLAAGLRVGASIAVNTAGSAAISATQQVASNAWSDQCLADGVGKSALKGALFGFTGAGLGSGYNAWASSRTANSFLNTSNSVSGPYLPPWSRNWAPGGTVGGNVIGNVIGNANQ